MLPPTSDSPIADDERISRLIFDNEHFTASTGNVSFRVFLPPNNGNFTEEVSVLRTNGIGEPDIWRCSDQVRHGALARADFVAYSVTLTAVAGRRLRVVPSEPPPKHALLLGWPPVIERELRKQLAQKLREAARPVLAVR